MADAAVGGGVNGTRVPMATRVTMANEARIFDLELGVHAKVFTF